ncbi:hypothetical protein GCM10023115_05730 [Pontixanthobacter gangjinensis]
MEIVLGRPKLKAEEKRKLVSARYAPSVVAKLRACAEVSGRSVPAEIEARILATIDLDDKGLELAASISSEMESLRRRNKGKRWHADITTWAATAEMLALGPIQDFKPSHDVDEECQEEAWAPLAKIREEQGVYISQLAEFGIAVARAREIRGLLKLNSRNREYARITAIEEDDLREQALKAHEELCQLDDAYDTALAAFRLTMQPYWDAEEVGRKIYRDHLHEEARISKLRGNPFRWSHLLRLHAPWR